MVLGHSRRISFAISFEVSCIVRIPGIVKVDPFQAAKARQVAGPCQVVKAFPFLVTFVVEGGKRLRNLKRVGRNLAWVGHNHWRQAKLGYNLHRVVELKLDRAVNRNLHIDHSLHKLVEVILGPDLAGLGRKQEAFQNLVAGHHLARRKVVEVAEEEGFQLQLVFRMLKRNLVSRCLL